jgi:cytidylate kinase
MAASWPHCSNAGAACASVSNKNAARVQMMAARTRPVIAIDGPVGAGKSTVARATARALGLNYLNTGAMYRAVALAAQRRGIDPGDAALAARLSAMLDAVSIAFDGERVMLDGADVSALITAPAIGDLASRLSALAVVRDKMRALQRAAGSGGGIVMEGRDIGTEVFPDAEFKFFLTADIDVRVERRFAELAAAGAAVTRAEVLAQLTERDRRDVERELAPLRRAADAIVIDSTGLGVDEVVREIKTRVSARIGA